VAEQRSPAVILSTRPLGEADLLVVLLTPDRGKIRAAARNARKSKRRFPGGLPGGALGEATLNRRSESSLWRIDAFRSVRDLGILGRDLTRFAYVAYLCEVTDALVSEPEPDPRRFASLATAVEALLDADRAPDPGILRRYELRLLDTLGLLPALDSCCACGEDLALQNRPDGAEIAFEPARGGALCSIHGAGAQRIPVQVLVLARALAQEEEGEPEAALAASTASVRRGLRDLTAALVRAQLRRPLRSLEFFSQLLPARSNQE
jgi:DNA repair protein RecO (recombination protein O)